MKSKAGFTLVELLIVMAIVAILGVIAVIEIMSWEQDKTQLNKLCFAWQGLWKIATQ